MFQIFPLIESGFGGSNPGRRGRGRGGGGGGVGVGGIAGLSSYHESTVCADPSVSCGCGRPSLLNKTFDLTSLVAQYKITAC